MITHIKNLVSKAVKGGYAIGAFNTANFETTKAILDAAQKQKSPIIIQVSEKTIEYAGLETIASIIRAVDKERKIKVPVAIHLDHGHSFLLAKRCIAAGFSSVQIDGSELPFKKNIALSRKVAFYAHRRDVWVQAELGSILGKEGLVKLAKGLKAEDYMTDPRQVREFIQETKIDTLAISVGTMHGAFRGKEKIDFKRLKEINHLARIPLVLHGASGNKDIEIKKAIKLGIRIINIDTEMRLAFTETLKKTLAKKMEKYDPRQILLPSIEAIQKIVENKIEVFGSKNKA